MRRQIVSASGNPGVNALFVHMVSIARNQFFHREFFRIPDVVVYNVHDNVDVFTMQFVNHGPQFVETGVRVFRIGGKPPFGNEILPRIVSPIVFPFRIFLIHAGKIEKRHQLDMGDAKPLEMIDPGRSSSGCFDA